MPRVVDLPKNYATDWYAAILREFERACEELAATGIEIESIWSDAFIHDGNPLVERVWKLRCDLSALAGSVLAERDEPPEDMEVTKNAEGGVISYRWLGSPEDRAADARYEAEIRAARFVVAPPARPMAARRARTRTRARRSPRLARAPGRSTDDPERPPDVDPVEGRAS